MRILVTGADGQVGWELRRSLGSLGQVTALDREAFDLTQPDRMRQVVRDLRPAVLVNAAAYTAVDRAESEPRLALDINGVAPGVMAEEMTRLGGLMVHYSTDYVFDGAGQRPWTEDDTPNPLGVYGRSKLAGEQAVATAGATHVVIRTSWVYGRRGSNFVRTVIRLALERDELRIVADQTGVPTWCRDLADWTATIVARLSPSTAASPGERGIFHLVSTGTTTWHGLAEAVVRLAPELAHRRHVVVVPIGTEDYPQPAKRPARSVLGCHRAERVFGIRPAHWEQALTRCLERG